MRIEPLDFEQLLQCKKTVAKISMNGYLQNVLRSKYAGKIDDHQREILLAGIDFLY